MSLSPIKKSQSFSGSFAIDNDSVSVRVDERLLVPPFDSGEDEDEDTDPNENTENTEDYEDTNGIDRAALAYLFRYEQMVRQQDAEDHATTSHLLPLFNRLRILGGDADENETDMEKNKEKDPQDQTSLENKNPISYDALQSKSANSTVNSIDEVHSMDEEQLEKSGHCEVSSLLSYKAMKKALYILEHTPSGQEEVLCTDQQLMLVLQELSAQLSALEGGVDDEWNSPDTSKALVVQKRKLENIRKHALSFPEFLHCYKTVVNGMMVLQMFPINSSSDHHSPTSSTTKNSTVSTSSPTNENQNAGILANELPQGIQYHRSRTKERSLSMLRTFGLNFGKKDPPKKGTSPLKITINSTAALTSASTTNDFNVSLMEEMRKIVALKDQQLVELSNKLRNTETKKELIDSKIVDYGSISLSTWGSSLNVKAFAHSYNKMNTLEKRRVTFGLIFGTCVLIWYSGAFFFMYVIKQPTSSIIGSGKNIDLDYISIEAYAQLQEMNKKMVSQEAYNELKQINSQLIQPHVYEKLQEENKKLIKPEVHSKLIQENKKLIKPEVYSTLQDSYDEALGKIAELEKTQTSNLRQISDLQALYAYFQKDCGSTIANLEKEISTCKNDLSVVKNNVTENLSAIETYTKELKACEKQVQQLVPENEEERLLMETNHGKERRARLRRQFKTFLIGTAGAIIGPMVIPMLVKLGSVTRITPVMNKIMNGVVRGGATTVANVLKSGAATDAATDAATSAVSSTATSTTTSAATSTAASAAKALKTRGATSAAKALKTRGATSAAKALKTRGATSAAKAMRTRGATSASKALKNRGATSASKALKNRGATSASKTLKNRGATSATNVFKNFGVEIR